MIIQKYNILFVDGIRCYKIDLSTRTLFIEYSIPQLIVISNVKISTNSWSDLLVKTVNCLIDKPKISEDKLIDFQVDWSTKQIFSRTKDNNFFIGPLINSLYLNINHNATHLLWLLQDLLAYNNIEPDTVELYIRILPSKEEAEVREYFINYYKNTLKHFLVNNLEYSEKKLNLFMSDFEKVDAIFNKCFANQVSLLLLNTKQIYASYKSRFISKLRNKKDSEKYLSKINSVLDVLTMYYYNFNKTLM